MEVHLRAAVCYLPYGTQPALTPARQAGIFNLPTREGRKAELI